MTSPPGDPVGTEAPGQAPVSADVDGLDPGATYHFRLVASNVTGTTVGPDETFTTTQAPSVLGYSSTKVTANSAELDAVINPNGYETTYYFEYGPTDSYGSRAPIPDGVIPAGSTPESIAVPLTGLKEEVTYHFRLTAENQWGATTTEDQTFDFSPPAGCPNHTARQQTGAGYLPDCRAYELVSPRRAGGAYLFAFGPSAPYASSPGRFAFAGLVNAIPGAGDPQGGTLNGDLYVASRGAGGWTTRYVGIPATEGIASSGSIDDEIYPPRVVGPSGIPTELGMNKLLVWDRAQNGLTNGGTLEGSYAPYMFDNEGNVLTRLPTNVDEVPGATTDISEGGFTGAARPSGDFSHYFFSTNALAFAEGGLTVAPGSAYDNELTSKTVTIVSKTPAGADIPKDPLAPDPKNQNNQTVPEYIRIPAASKDGSHVLMSTLAPEGRIHLYMRVNGAVSYDVSVGQDALNHGVNLSGMTSDGTAVFFTSAEQLTADDTDASIDLYKWSESTDSVTRLSTGTGASGNTDACSASWIGSCGVEVVPTERENYFGESSWPVDSVIADDTGEIYFYSPEELDGVRGAFGARNLYVYRNGAPRHVATFEPNRPAERLEVSPDGNYAALLTKSRLTAYDNATASQMYRYDPSGRTMLCVSCRQDGGPPLGQVEASQNGLFMTDDGRVFFATGDALVPRDADGVADVYEYVDGRAQLISSGVSDAGQTENQKIGLVGVSADGVDAFFATVDTLVAQDENGPNLKFYDARTNGGFAVNKPAAPCEAADECHGPESQAPAPLTIGTAGDLGYRGNVQATTNEKRSCKKGKGKRCRHKKRSHGNPGGRRHG
jgi:hypothetical protein